MKESELSTSQVEWQHALISYELAQGMYVNSMSPHADASTKFPSSTGQNPMDLDKKVILENRVTVPAFASQIVGARTEKMQMMGHRLNVMVQLLYLEDKAKLPVGLYMQRVYTELKDGSRALSVVLRNGTGKPMCLPTGQLIGHVVVANTVPDAIPSPELEAKLAEDGQKVTPLTAEQCQTLLIKVLEKNGSLGKLDSWLKETAQKAKWLLTEFHHIFSLKEGKIGCMDVAEHVIELLEGQDKPIKERFRRIGPHQVEEVREHLQEMLDGGAIRPSQLPWCNAIVLVCKKDSTLRFCIDFHCLNTCTKKDSYPIPRDPETIESLVGSPYFSTMDLKSSFWQVKVAEESCQYMVFTVSRMGIYEFLCMPYGLCNASATFQHVMQNCLGELNLSFALIYLDDVIMYSRMPDDHLE